MKKDPVLRDLEDAIVALEAQLPALIADPTDPERILAQLVWSKLSELERLRERFLVTVRSEQSQVA